MTSSSGCSISAEGKRLPSWQAADHAQGHELGQNVAVGQLGPGGTEQRPGIAMLGFINMMQARQVRGIQEHQIRS
jgi:hypothetical protein